MVRARYAVNGAVPQDLPTVTSGRVSAPTFTIPAASRAAFFNSSSKAGILAFTLTAAEVPVTFDRFGLAAADLTAPAAPTGLVATTPSTTSVGLDWADNGEADLAAYDVYRAPNPEGPYAKINASPISASTYTDTGLTSGTLYAYQVRALDVSGNVSAASAAATALSDVASPPAAIFPVRVNFQNETATPIPTGYTRDFGQNYANVRGFGWVVPGTATPRSLVGNGRDRNDATTSDQRVDTLMHMQGNNVTNFANVALPGAWEIAVPNGTYSVEVSVGDPTPGADLTSHELNVEGVKAIDSYAHRATTGAARWSSATVSATVSDGRLTIDPLGGINTKINYVVINPADTTPPDAPVITTPAADGYDLDGDLTLAGSAEAGSSVELFDGATSRGTTTATGGTWTISLTDVADGVHVYTAKATDAAPNTSPASAARTITVDTAAPTVTDRSPLADATGVAVDVTVTAELSEALDPATVSATSVTLVAGSTAVPASVDYDELTDTISLNPDADLEPGTTYTVSLGTTIEDLAGNALSRHHVGLRHAQPGGHHAARRADHHDPGRRRLRPRRRPDPGRQRRGGQQRRTVRRRDLQGHHDRDRRDLDDQPDRRRRRRPRVHRQGHRRRAQHVARVGRPDDHRRHRRPDRDRPQPARRRDRRGRRRDRQRRALRSPRPGDRERHQRHPRGRLDGGPRERRLRRADRHDQPEPGRRPRARHDLHGQPRHDHRGPRRPDPSRDLVGLRHAEPPPHLRVPRSRRCPAHRSR